ncbi:hypothetical protein DTO96_102223 [Ephemeroptericola cinctiostellae]|uniref:Uncharacterized protein n=1 Tax=Ephemeroptericola cinctiostellae TaxID=2268024 RepID=A0A345DDN1_9BURK|nr:hypothetical protein [Ephemeroptericola cinctiostellae]AXF86469.1 hypothetical protein DTO96_102223 [Ephemeroptericola cinctiostellae]
MDSMINWLLSVLAELVFYNTGALALRLLSFGQIKLDYSKLSISQSNFVALFGLIIWIGLVLMIVAVFFQ